MDAEAPGDMELTAPADGDVRRGATAGARAERGHLERDRHQRAGGRGRRARRGEDRRHPAGPARGRRPRHLRRDRDPSRSSSVDGPALDRGGPSCCWSATAWWCSDETDSQRLERGFDPGRSSSTSPTRHNPRSSTTRDVRQLPGHRPAARRHGPAGARRRAARPRLRRAEWWRDDDSALERNRRGRAPQHPRGLAAVVTPRRRGPAAARLRPTWPCPTTRPGSGRWRWWASTRPTPTPGPAPAVATESPLAYFSQDRMYLATSAWSDAWPCCWEGDVAVRPTVPATDGASHLYAFELERHRRDVRRVRRGGRRRSPTAGRWTSTTACCASRSGRPMSDRQLQLDRDPRGGGRRPGRDRPGGRARRRARRSSRCGGSTGWRSW